MATLNEIAYDILTAVRPQLSDDTELEIRQIKFWIKNQRALLIRNEINRNRTIDADITQTLCVEIECVNASECCDIELGDKILRSKKELPDTLEMHNKQAILRVGPINKKKESFNFVEYERVPFLTSSRFTKNMVFAFVKDKYLYIYSDNPRYRDIEAVALRGVFEDPEAAKDFKDCVNTNEPCYTDDSPFPMKTWMLPNLKQVILSQFGAVSQAEATLTDDTNNAKADVGQK